MFLKFKTNHNTLICINIENIILYSLYNADTPYIKLSLQGGNGCIVQGRPEQLDQILRKHNLMDASVLENEEVEVADELDVDEGADFAELDINDAADGDELDVDGEFANNGAAILRENTLRTRPAPIDYNWVVQTMPAPQAGPARHVGGDDLAVDPGEARPDDGDTGF